MRDGFPPPSSRGQALRGKNGRGGRVRGGCRKLPSVYNSHKNIPPALNLSASEPRPMKASEFKNNHLILSGIRAPQVNAEG